MPFCFVFGKKWVGVGKSGRGRKKRKLEIHVDKWMLRRRRRRRRRHVRDGNFNFRIMRHLERSFRMCLQSINRYPAAIETIENKMVY